MTAGPFVAPRYHGIFEVGDWMRIQAYRVAEAARHAEIAEKIRADRAPKDRPSEAPVIIVGMVEARGEQVSDGAAQLETAAVGNGWTVRITYAMAMLDGSTIETCCVRLAKGAVRGWASWRRTRGAWSFEQAWVALPGIGPKRFGWQRSKTNMDKQTIRELVSTH